MVDAPNSAIEQATRDQLIEWVQQRQSTGQEVFEYAELARVALGAQDVRALDRQRGIWRPRGFHAALSIKTTYTGEGQPAPYEDGVGRDGLLRYKYEGDNPELWTNVALRRAMAERLPVVWFIGIAKSRFVATAPVWLIGEEPQNRQFVLALEPGQRALYEPGEQPDEDLRRYAERISKQRLHQPMFRGRVMVAYGQRCAICRLNHADLLDAAHIVSDAEDLGAPIVANGLALCKIHHAAFDRNILGVRPDLVVQIRRDILEESDGPMLRHGLQDVHGQPLSVLPTRQADQPDPGRLELRWDAFQKAG